MSVSSILSQDITLSTLENSLNNLSNLSSREQLILKAYLNEPWLKGKSHAAIIDEKTTRADRELLFQILLIENVSKSKQSQLDDLKAKIDPKHQKVDRIRKIPTSNSTTTSRRYEMVTQINMDEESDSNRGVPNSNKQDKVVYKLTIQSKSGDVFNAINSVPLPWISCMLGSKIIIKPGTIFNRGVFLFQESSQVVFLGGINRIWNENKDIKMCDYYKARLERDKHDQSTSKTRKRKATALD